MTFGHFKYERTDSGIRIDKYTRSASSVNIPAQINGVPVTSIGDEVFMGCKSLSSVVIPDSVTSIGNRAFRNCNSLKSITIPDSVTSIGGSAFRNCKSLTSVVIPNSVTSIGDSAFYDCKSLTSIVIPDSVTYIGGNAFYDCKSLTSIVIPDSVTSIGYKAFSGCKSLTSVVIPDSVTTIGNEAFSGCSSLKNALICNPDTGTSSAFDTHTDITYARFPKSLMKSAVFKNTLQNCRDDYSKIRYYQFLNNFFYKIRRLQNASNLPDDIHTSVKQIETLVLSNRCTTAIFNGTDSILDDFITIQKLQQKFETNSVINLITLVNGVSQKKITNVLKYIQTYDEIAKIKVAAQENLRALTGEKTAAKRQTEPVTSRPRQNPVPGVANSASVQDNLPNEDFSIEYNPFGITIKKYNGSADFVNIPSQINGLPVTTISKGAFGDCKSLTSIVIPDSVTTIGKEAFRNCTSLTSVVIPDSFTIIGKEAFMGCESLSSVVIPDSVTTIGGSAFYGCRSLTSVVIPNSVTSIGNRAFSECKSLSSVVIPDSVTSIGNRAFSECKSLSSVVIPDSVTTIGNEAFSGCESLSSVVIPDSVTSIGGRAFRKCESLKTIYFPRALMDVNGRDNMLKNFRNDYNDKIRYYNTVSEIKELMESPDFEK